MAEEQSYFDVPFRIDSRGRAAATRSDDHVLDMIRLVLFTEPGERVNRPDFGCGLRQLVFAPASDALVAAVETLVHGSLIRWLEGVISVEALSVTAEDGRLDIDITYSRLDTGSRHAAQLSHRLAQ